VIDPPGYIDLPNHGISNWKCPAFFDTLYEAYRFNYYRLDISIQFLTAQVEKLHFFGGSGVFSLYVPFNG
jgi:hypothetical protein